MRSITYVFGAVAGFFTFGGIGLIIRGYQLEGGITLFIGLLCLIQFLRFLMKDLGGSKMRGTITEVENNLKMLTINFNDADPIRRIFGRTGDTCNVDNSINQVKSLFQQQITGFIFPDPTHNQIRVDYVDEPIDKINITWPDNYGNGPFDFVGINQSCRARIFMTYPIKNNYMNALQLLSHEIGHWFFNRVVDDRIGADNHHICRNIDISNYEDFSEKAAYYSEIKIAGERREYPQRHIRIIQEVKEAIRTNNNTYLSDLLQSCLDQFERERNE